MIEFAAAIEGTDLAQFMKATRWVYPFVNAGHILGIAMLVGAILPMDLALAGIVRRIAPEKAVASLRPFAVAGLVLATCCGALLFVTQASDYVGNQFFVIKMGLVVLASLNAVTYPRQLQRGGSGIRLRALLSLVIWIAVLILGRLVGYTF